MNERTESMTTPNPQAEQVAAIGEVVGSMRNFADVADRCELTEGNAPAAIRAWAWQLEAVIDLMTDRQVQPGVVQELLLNIKRSCIRGRNVADMKAEKNFVATCDHIENLADQAIKYALPPPPKEGESR